MCISLPQCCDKRLILGRAWGDATLILPLISSAVREGFFSVFVCEVDWIGIGFIDAVYKTKT